MADGRAGINAELVRQLVAEQFPQWARLPVAPVPVDGWDNRTYRLGPELTVRLPSADGYVPAVAKESRWLPVLAEGLPLPIPEIVAEGRPSRHFGRPWSVRRWIPGEVSTPTTVADHARFADRLAEFLLALQAIDAEAGPPAGAHSFYRGAPLSHYDDQTRRCLAAAADRIDVDRVAGLWQEALSTGWDRPPVWFHGDIAAGNLLLRDGELAAVIDFGTSGVGDPACDLVISWTFLDRPGRAAYRSAMAQDEACWARARGWALWKALLGLDGPAAAENIAVIEAVLNDAG